MTADDPCVLLEPFLVDRADDREARRGMRTDRAVAHGIKQTAGVVTSAAVVMVTAVGVNGADAKAKKAKAPARRRAMMWTRRRALARAAMEGAMPSSTAAANAAAVANSYEAAPTTTMLRAPSSAREGSRSACSHVRRT